MGRRQLRTVYLRAPYIDFAALAQGYKTEFRARRRGAAAAQTPTPVVLYAVSSGGHRVEELMVLTEYREERLFDISENPEALMREGFESYDAFRGYWRRREKRQWNPLAEVGVFRLRPWLESDRLRLGMLLFDRLYADYLPNAQRHLQPV